MQIAQLTKAEEQVMQYLWEIEKGFLKDILELFPEPKPHTNTVSTILKVLKEKDFVDYEVHGRQHQYFPLISKDRRLFFSAAATLIKGICSNRKGTSTELKSLFTD